MGIALYGKFAVSNVSFKKENFNKIKNLSKGNNKNNKKTLLRLFSFYN